MAKARRCGMALNRSARRSAERGAPGCGNTCHLWVRAGVYFSSPVPVAPQKRHRVVGIVMVHLQDGQRPTHSNKAPCALAYVIAGCFLFHLHPYILIYVYFDGPT